MLNTNDEAGPTGLATGTKIAVIISALLLAVAVYFFVSPTNFRGKDGSLFGCGSPMSPNTSGLAKGQCNIIEDQALHRALLFLALALITAALGYLLFGSHGSRGGSRGGRSRARYDDDHDDDDAFDSERDDVRGARRQRTERSTRRARLGDEDVPATRGATRESDTARTRRTADDDELRDGRD